MVEAERGEIDQNSDIMNRTATKAKEHFEPRRKYAQEFSEDRKTRRKGIISQFRAVSKEKLKEQKNK